MAGIAEGAPVKLPSLGVIKREIESATDRGGFGLFSGAQWRTLTAEQQNEAARRYDFVLVQNIEGEGGDGLPM